MIVARAQEAEAYGDQHQIPYLQQTPSCVNEEQRGYQRRSYGLGLVGCEVGGESELTGHLDSIAIGQPSYESWSGVQPMEPLSRSPTDAYQPWVPQHAQERQMPPDASNKHLIPSKRGSVLSSHYHDHVRQDFGASYHSQQCNYRDATVRQRSNSLCPVDMGLRSRFTAEEPENFCKIRLLQYGLHDENGNKTTKFWILILAFCITVTLTALDMTMISTALPSIVEDLPTSDIAGGWVTSSYLLTVTAFQPLFGGLSCVIGRRWSAVLAVMLFIGGSVMCGFAHSILFLTVGRGVQGLGGGGIQAVGEITVSDITTLRERGFFVGIFGLVFAISSFVAPVLGGYFSDHDWRWIFWINIPIGVIAILMLIPTMNLPVPTMSLKSKVARMDMVGNAVLLGSVVSILIAVTEGGITHPWSSMKIWIPMVAGMAGFLLFLLIEFVPNPLSSHPVLPLKLFSNRTACSAFIMTFVHGIATYGAIYALPIYFQSIHDETPLRSAISTFPSTAPTAPFAIVAGIVMAVTGKYRNLTFGGWALAAGGFGWMTRFQSATSDWELIVAQIVAGLGIGILFAITLPPIQASLPIDELERATAAFAFCRSFGAIWGIAITTSVLTASVSGRLWTVPQAEQLGLTGPTVLGYVENIKLLPGPIRDQVRQMYADGLQKAMYCFVPVVLVGFVCCFWIEDLPLPDFIRDSSNAKEHVVEKEVGEQDHHSQKDHYLYGERGDFHNQSTMQHQGYAIDEKIHATFGESSQDTTLVGSFEQGAGPTILTDNEGTCDVVRYQSEHYHAQCTPDGYASQAFTFGSSTEPLFGHMHDEKSDLQHGITAPPRAYW